MTQQYQELTEQLAALVESGRWSATLQMRQRFYMKGWIA